MTISRLMRLAALAGARRFGPEPGSAPVSAITLADADAPEQEGALVLSPGGVPEELPAGCAAVICRAAPAVPPTVPTIVLPPGAPWGTLIRELVGALGAPEHTAYAEEARRALRRPLVEAAGHYALADVGAELVGGPVACLDDYLDLLGASGIDPAQREELDAAIARARGHSPASVLGPFLHDELPECAMVPVEGASGPVGVVVAWIARPATLGQEAALGELAEAVAVELGRDRVRTETEARLRGDLIEELLAGDTASRESLVRRARHLGADIATGAVALLGRLHDPHNEGRVVTDARLARRLLLQARAAVDLHWPGALVDWSDGELLVLLPPTAALAEGRPVDVEDSGATLARRLLAATRETVPGLALTLGLSRYTPQPERLGAALEEARLALSIGERLGRIGEVVTFEETGTYKLLFQVLSDRPDELRSFYDGTLDPLVRYDEQYQTDLVGTLATYLGNDGNLAATASMLYTHRHTIRYRLDRIAELSGLDVSKTDDREKLSLGLKAMRLLGRRIPRVDERPPRQRRGRRGAA